MKSGLKWTIGLGISAALCLAVARWLPTDDDLSAWLTVAAKEQLGVKVTIGSVHWALLPKPVIVVNDFRTQQEQPLIIGQLSAYPEALALLSHKLRFERIDVDDAVFPHNSVRALHVKSNVSDPSESDSVPLEHLEFRNLTYISYSGVAVAYNGNIDFDSNWRPRRAELRHIGTNPTFLLTLTRAADADHWQARIHVGAGSADGRIALETNENGAMHLSGELTPRNIELDSALSSFNLRSPIGGNGSGQTDLSAEGNSAGELVRSLHTRTTLSVNPATVLRFDLDKAVSTGGKQHRGQTALQELSGQMDTQNTDQGMRVTYSNIKARAGEYMATGEATIYHHQIDAKGRLSRVDGTITVPFTATGPINKPKISAPPGVVAGAVIGTAILPGTGTRIGARIGGAFGRLFNHEKK
jgi:hypothetical protein